MNIHSYKPIYMTIVEESRQVNRVLLDYIKADFYRFCCEVIMSSKTVKKINSLYDLKPGDHIKYDCILNKEKKTLAAMHHALVVSVVNEVQVRIIHNNGDSIIEEVITLDPSDVLLVEYSCLYPGEKAIERARERIGGSYALLTDNCEHFVTWARSGSAHSKQVQEGIAAGLGGLAGGALVGAEIGSLVPVVGTISGAAIGGAVGLIGGLLVFSKRRKSKYE